LRRRELASKACLSLPKGTLEETPRASVSLSVAICMILRDVRFAASSRHEVLAEIAQASSPRLGRLKGIKTVGDEFIVLTS
jgi:hypothetical protein